MKKILLLGSGELGKELVISLQRLGQHVIAVDSYDNAPAMQVSDEREVINMLDGNELDRLVAQHQPDLVVPEVESIRTERFYDYETQNIQVVPSAKAANFTMNRRAIRDLAAQELNLKTAKYAYATSLEELQNVVNEIGMPCVVKPLMSSSGKGQSYIKTEADIAKSWQYALDGSRGDLVEVIVEEFIDFQFEITLLTVTQQSGKTLFCPPIGHRQERGDYQESWQPMKMKPELLKEAERMADEVTKALGGAGIWGVEFFIGENEVWFSELSPRPHDTGMVTLAGTQNLTQFELHARTILGLPITDIVQEKVGASAVILADKEGPHPQFTGVSEAISAPKTDIRIFGKPTTRPYRRMGVTLTFDDLGTDTQMVRDKAQNAAGKVNVFPKA